MTIDPIMPLGKLPPDPQKPALKLVLAPELATSAPPVARDWLGRVLSWPMYANDQYGCCVWAMIGHAIKAWTTYAGAPIELTTVDLLKGYTDVTGFDPNDPSTDQGTLLQDALNYWRKTGIAGHKILAFGKVNHKDPQQMQAAINVFGALMVGIEFPGSAMKQFRAHQAWTVASREGGIEGGHAIHAGQYDPDGYKVTTWGDVQAMDAGFAAKYVDEAWAVITPEWLTAAGTTIDGFDLHTLGERLSALTGEPNPFTAPPPPLPVPPAPSADAQLAAALREHGWVQRKHIGVTDRVAHAGREWLAARGL